MATYYVSPTGTNDASHGTAEGSGAWLTLTYALSSSGVPLTGGPHSLIVADGTYSEGTTGGLLLARKYADLLTVTGNVPTPANCIVQGGTTDVLLALAVTNAKNITLRGFTFRANGGGTTGTYLCRQNGTAEAVSLVDCVFTLPAVASLTVYVNLQKLITGLTFERCTINAAAAASQSGILISGTTGVIPTGMVVKDCTITATDTPITGYDLADMAVTGCTLKGAGGYVLRWQRDGVANTNNGALTCENNTIVATGTATHTILLGTGSVNSRVRNCVVDAHLASSGYGVVNKGTDDLVEDCLVLAGGNPGYYLKGSTRAIGSRCTVIQENASGQCIASTTGIGTTVGSVIQGFSCIAMPGSTVFDWRGHDTTDSVRLLSVSGAIGVNTPSNGYGSPKASIRPALPMQHGWQID